MKEPVSVFIFPLVWNSSSAVRSNAFRIGSLTMANIGAMFYSCGGEVSTDLGRQPDYGPRKQLLQPPKPSTYVKTSLIRSVCNATPVSRVLEISSFCHELSFMNGRSRGPMTRENDTSPGHADLVKGKAKDIGRVHHLHGCLKSDGEMTERTANKR
nr:hypothetical protein CFP56_23861 [Quercus suber]